MIGDMKLSRALFCFGVQTAFYEAPADIRKQIFNSLQEAYDRLGERFGVKVLATLDDDRFVVGPANAYPWTCYMLAEIPNIEAVTQVCNILREVRIGDDLLWKYMRVEARIGRELFFCRT